MSTCKKCIHQKSCINWARTCKGNGRSVEDIVRQISEGEHYSCEYFQDRSKFIEPPCKLGESLYAINGKGEIKSWEIICIRAIKSSIKWNPEHIEYTIGCEKNNGIMWVHLDKAKNIYFNSEEAEQALKERKNGT